MVMAAVVSCSTSFILIHSQVPEAAKIQRITTQNQCQSKHGNNEKETEREDRKQSKENKIKGNEDLSGGGAAVGHSFGILLKILTATPPGSPYLSRASCVRPVRASPSISCCLKISCLLSSSSHRSIEPRPFLVLSAYHTPHPN